VARLMRGAHLPDDGEKEETGRRRDVAHPEHSSRVAGNVWGAPDPRRARGAGRPTEYAGGSSS
jgi:hypothetical protein